MILEIGWYWVTLGLTWSTWMLSYKMIHPIVGNTIVDPMCWTHTWFMVTMDCRSVHLYFNCWVWSMLDHVFDHYFDLYYISGWVICWELAIWLYLTILIWSSGLDVKPWCGLETGWSSFMQGLTWSTFKLGHGQIHPIMGTTIADPTVWANTWFMVILLDPMASTSTFESRPGLPNGCRPTGSCSWRCCCWGLWQDSGKSGLHRCHRARGCRGKPWSGGHVWIKQLSLCGSLVSVAGSSSSTCTRK